MTRGQTRGQTRAAIYARISSDDEGSGAGVDRQVADCTSLCVARGWSVDSSHVYVDNDISASTGRHRPGYERLLASVSAGELDAVVAYHLDRITRRPVELEQFLDTCQLANLAHFATVTGDFDLGSDDARFTARILGAVARKEADVISRRVARAARERAVEGRPNGGGRRSLGYTLAREVVEEEAEVVREMAARVLAGESLMSIGVELTARGQRGPGGAALDSRSIGRLLRNPMIAGLRSHQGEIVAQGTWEALVAREEWERVVRVLDERGRARASWTPKYLLAGRIECGLCHAPMVATPRYRVVDGERVLVRAYGCRAKKHGGSGCGGVSITAEVADVGKGGEIGGRVGIERFVCDWLLDRLAGPREADPGVLLHPPTGDGGVGLTEVVELRREVDSDAAALIELDDDYRIYRVVERAVWMRQRVQLVRRIDANNERIQVLTSVVHFDEAMVDLHELHSLPFERKRAVIRHYIDRVVVKPIAAGRRVEERVEVFPNPRVVLGAP